MYNVHVYHVHTRDCKCKRVFYTAAMNHTESGDRASLHELVRCVLCSMNVCFRLNFRKERCKSIVAFLVLE